MGNVTINTIPKSEINGIITSLVNSQIGDNGSTVDIGATAPTGRFHVKPSGSENAITIEGSAVVTDDVFGPFVLQQANNISQRVKIEGLVLNFADRIGFRFTTLNGGNDVIAMDVNFDGSVDVFGNMTASTITCTDCIATG